LVTIPGYQTIRNDLQRVLERNRAASPINTTLGEIESRIQQTPDLYEPDPYVPGASLKEFTFKNEICFSACCQMRASDVTNQFATILARALWIDEGSILFVALRSLIRAWREWRYEIDPRQPTPDPAVGSTVKDYLTRFDLPYRIRRLRFVLRKLDTLYGLQLEPDHPAYEEAVSTRAFGLSLSAREREPPKVTATDLTEVRLPLSRECAKLQRTLSRLLELHNPPDTDTPNQPPSPDNDSQSIVLKALPDNASELLIPVLLDIARVSQPEGQENQPRPDNKRELLTTEPLNRSARESRLTNLACDRRAAKRLAIGPVLRDNLDSVARNLEAWLVPLFNDAHQAAVAAFGGGDASQIARRYYQCFDFFDCVQFPMMFGTDIGEPDTVDIIRVCPEDAPALVPDDVQERRTKLKVLAVVHFGAFLDRDWRVSDLLWGRLDGAERIITALLPLQQSAQLRNRLIDEAHAAILAEFQARPRLGTMALNPTRNQSARNPLTPQIVQQVIDAIALHAAAASRQTQTTFMSLWRTLMPAEPDRVMLVRTLARGTTIVGRMFDGIAGSSQLSTPARTPAKLVGGLVIADTRDALTLREASYPAVQYIPRRDVDMAALTRSEHTTYCPYKGDASYYSIPAGGGRSLNAVWTYEAIAQIKDYVAFYPDRVDEIR
jgi:uncharacterized protein (DUF427 family)